MHPRLQWGKIFEKFWYKDRLGYVFSNPENRTLKIVQFREIICCNHNEVKSNYNPYFDELYYQILDEERSITKKQKKYKSIWNNQGGLCYYCKKPMLIDQDVTIVKSLSTHKNPQKSRYIHEKCLIHTHEYKEVDFNIDKFSDKELLEEIKLFENEKKIYNGLNSFFQKEKRQVFMLTFKQIENIIGRELDWTAYFTEKFWYDSTIHSHKADPILDFVKIDYENVFISECWLNNGYIIDKLDVENRKVYFFKENHNIENMVIPKKIKGKIPKGAKHELDVFFKYIINKYNL